MRVQPIIYTAVLTSLTAATSTKVALSRDGTRTLTSTEATLVRGGQGEAQSCEIEHSNYDGRRLSRELYADNPRIDITFDNDGKTRQFHIQQGNWKVPHSTQNVNASGREVRYRKRMTWILNPESSTTSIFQKRAVKGCWDEGEWDPDCDDFGPASLIDYDEGSWGTRKMHLAKRVKVAGVRFHRLVLIDEGEVSETYGDPGRAQRLVDNVSELDWGNQREMDHDTPDGLALQCVGSARQHWQFRYLGNTDHRTTISSTRYHSCKPEDRTCEDLKKRQASSEKKIIDAAPGEYHVFWYGSIRSWDEEDEVYRHGTRGFARLDNRYMILRDENDEVGGTFLHEFGHSAGRKHWGEATPRCTGAGGRPRALMCPSHGTDLDTDTCNSMGFYNKVNNLNLNKGN